MMKKENVEHALTMVLIVLLLPCAMTLLMNGKMQEIYRKIQDRAAYISVKTNTGVSKMNLEEYVIGVTAAQIPLDYETEAIKAQMVIARTNLYRQMQAEKIWDGEYISLTELRRKGAAEKFLKAQKSTDGEILTYEARPVMASFHALSAGKTRDGTETFQSDAYGYLKSKVCPSDEKAENFRSEIQIDDSWKNLKILNRDSAGYVKQLQFENSVMSGEEFRNMLGLPSAAFELKIGEKGVFLTTKGIGHGLGMSQYTAQQMALVGKNYREILAYFFEDTEVKKHS